MLSTSAAELTLTVTLVVTLLIVVALSIVGVRVLHQGLRGVQRTPPEDPSRASERRPDAQSVKGPDER